LRADDGAEQSQQGDGGNGGGPHEAPSSDPFHSGPDVRRLGTRPKTRISAISESRSIGCVTGRIVSSRAQPLREVLLRGRGSGEVLAQVRQRLAIGIDRVEPVRQHERVAALERR